MLTGRARDEIKSDPSIKVRELTRSPQEHKTDGSVSARRQYCKVIVITKTT